MGKKRNVRITDIDVAMAVIAHEAVPCFCGKEQKRSVQPKRLTSCAGGNFWGRSEERWPSSADGEPLIPWLQVVCSELHRVYGAFYNRAVVCFYLRPDFADFEATSTFDSGDFVVREYGLDDQLVPLARPASLSGHPYHRVTWEKMNDYPSISNYDELFDETVYASLCEMKNFKYENHFRDQDRGLADTGATGPAISRLLRDANRHDRELHLW